MDRIEFFRRIESHLAELTRAGVRRIGGPDPFEFAALRDGLAETFGCPVDLTTQQGLKPRLRSRILDDVRYAV